MYLLFKDTGLEKNVTDSYANLLDYKFTSTKAVHLIFMGNFNCARYTALHKIKY